MSELIEVDDGDSVTDKNTNNSRIATIKTELKWEVALKFLTQFDSSKTVTKIVEPIGGDVYIFFSSDEDDIKDLATVDKWQWHNNRNKAPFPSKTNCQLLKTYYDARTFNAGTGEKTNSIYWRKRIYQLPSKTIHVLVHYIGYPKFTRISRDLYL